MSNVKISEIDFADFNFVWDSWILPTIHKMYEKIDPDFKEATKCNIKDLDNIKSLANRFYIEKRESVKREYYGTNFKTDGKPYLMDFHKLSSVLCRTLIEYKVFTFDVSRCKSYITEKKIDNKNTDWLVHNALVNFRLAFYVSVVFLYQSMLFKTQEDSQLYELLLKRKKLDLYTKSSPGNNHESFENSLVLDLAKRDINNHSFDCFFYSAIMYQLEEYNLMLLRQELDHIVNE